MSANRIQKYLPANRIATASAPAVSVNCAAFAFVGGGNASSAGANFSQVYQMAWEAARLQVAAKRRFRVAQSVNYLWN